MFCTERPGRDKLESVSGEPPPALNGRRAATALPWRALHTVVRTLERSEFMVGRTVLQYQFLEKLGAGGMGEIFKAQDKRLNRFVAVKILTTGRADLEHRRRFLQEAQAASALNHPNIITIHDIVSDNDMELMVMEFVAGKTLMA